MDNSGQKESDFVHFCTLLKRFCTGFLTSKPLQTLTIVAFLYVCTLFRCLSVFCLVLLILFLYVCSDARSGDNSVSIYIYTYSNKEEKEKTREDKEDEMEKGTEKAYRLLK